MSQRPVFVVSDGSGLTAETIAHTLLSQFPGIEFDQVSLPFVDSDEKVELTVSKINEAGHKNGVKPLVFITFVDDKIATRLGEAEAEIFDLFDPFISRMELTLGQQSSHQPGQSHGVSDTVLYSRRIDAVNFAMQCDDGLHTRDYARANVILIAPSRSGKTPTCLYLALHFGFYAANYPLTEEDFERDKLPDAVLENRDRVFGLTIDPLRLHQIRSERRPGSDYASLRRCQGDIQIAQQMYNRYSIPNCDSTNYSVEELGSTIKHRMGLQSQMY